MTNWYSNRNLVGWLANGERGVSSETIVQTITGIPCKDAGCHPLDPSDFGRCVKLLERVPALKNNLYLMADVSPIWKGLVNNWETLYNMLESESPYWRDGKGTSPKTYALLKTIINSEY